MLVVSRPIGTFWDSGDMSPLTFGKYKITIFLLVGTNYAYLIDLPPLDFKLDRRVASQLSKAYESHHHTYTKYFHTVGPPEFLHQLP